MSIESGFPFKQGPPSTDDTILSEDSTSEQEPKVTPELVKKCEDIARQFVRDIIHAEENIPIRFQFSGLLEKTFREGFEENSFYVEERGGVNVDYAREHTRNDALSHLQNKSEFEDHGLQGTYQLKEKDLTSSLEDPLLEELYNIYQTISPDLNEKIKARLSELDYSQENSGSVVYDKYRVLFQEVARCSRELGLRLHYPNISKIKKALGEENPELTSSVIKKAVISIPYEKWSFEEKELWYEKTVKVMIESNPNFYHGLQIYDSALLIDRDKINKSKSGYLPDVEIEVTAPPEIMIGALPFHSPVDIEPGDYVKEKLLRLYHKNPELSRPLYSKYGELIWPPEPITELHSRGNQGTAARVLP